MSCKSKYQQIYDAICKKFGLESIYVKFYDKSIDISLRPCLVGVSEDGEIPFKTTKDFQNVDFGYIDEWLDDMCFSCHLAKVNVVARLLFKLAETSAVVLTHNCIFDDNVLGYASSKDVVIRRGETPEEVLLRYDLEMMT